MASTNLDFKHAQLSAIATRYATAALIAYSGTVPTDADTALSGNTALAAHTLAGFSTPSSGSMLASAIADVVIADTGTATFFRATVGTEVLQLIVGTDVIVDSSSYVSGEYSKILTLTVTQA